MAFKMAPKSPVLMATGKFGSPAKQTKQGTNQTIEAKGKPEGPALTALQQAQQEANSAQLDNKVAQIRRNTAGTKKENARLRKRTARDNSGAERKNKNAEKTQNRVDEREESGKTRVGKVVDKIKKAVSPAKQSTRTTRLKNKEAKETNKIIRGEKTSARKVNRLNDRLEVSKAKDKVKAVRKSQRAQKLEDKAAVLNNEAQG
jgi:hypothetical protein